YGTAQLQNFAVTEPGTYYLLVYSPYNAARYQMRVDQSRDPPLEAEGDDGQTGANVLLLTSPAVGTAQGSVAGSLVAGDPGDYYHLGALNAGNVIALNDSLPSFGSLATADLRLTVEADGSTTPLATSTTGALTYVVPADG